MKNTRMTSIIAVFVVGTMIAGCATPNGMGSMSQGDPCQPNGAQSSYNPTASFISQAILSPLANIGGTLLATAAQNYSGKYAGKLNKLLTKLVTPKKKKKKKPAQQPVEQGNPYGDQGYQPGYGYENEVDPNTGLPIQDSSGFQDQIDPNTGFPVEPDFPGQEDFGQNPEQIDPNTGLPFDPGFADEGQFQEEFPQEGDQFEPEFGDQGQFEPAAEEGIGEFDPNIQGDTQTRGVSGRSPHAVFPSQPCNPQQQVQGYPAANQPYGHDPAYQSGGYDPYAQQQGQDPYGQTDPYGQQGYPQDPYGQQDTQQQGQNPYGQTDPYAQQDYPQDPYGQEPHQQDPYGQQGYPEDPYGQQPQQPDPYGQQEYQENPYGQEPQQQDPYAQQGYPQNSNTSSGYAGQEGATNGIGLDVVMLKKTIRNGAAVMLPIKDGDVLQDGRGNAKAGDKFRIMFRPHTDGYVYVVAIDGSGWAQGIFPPPTSPLANPVKAGHEYTLPEGNNWFSLDQFKGIETIFFVASQEKRQDLEEVLQSITGHERPATATPQQVTKVAMVPYGVGGARPSAKGFNLPSASGTDQTIIPTSYFSKTAGQDLRLTRWFRHE